MSRYFRAKWSAPDWSLQTWIDFLTGLGMPFESFGIQKPCPICNGEDRFSFNLYRGKPRWFCRNPEGVHSTRNPKGFAAGDPVGLMMEYFGWTFTEARKAIEGDVQTVVRPKYVQKKQVVKDKRAELKKAQFKLNSLVNDLVRLDHADAAPARRYLESRGLIELKHTPQGDYWAFLPTGDVAFHPSAYGVTEDKELFFHPAIVCLLRFPDGRIAGAHKTFITEEGKKIDFAAAKQLTRIAPSLNGSSVELFLTAENQSHALVGEGLESSLAACRLFHRGGFACMTAGLLSEFKSRRFSSFVIAGDNDLDKRPEGSRGEGDGFVPAGQAAAASLAGRLIGLGWPDVQVRMPPVGRDWNDVLLDKQVAA